MSSAVKAVVTDWRGHMQFSCPLCAFDTLSEQQFDMHVGNAHPDWQPPPPEPEPEPERVISKTKKG